MQRIRIDREGETFVLDAMKDNIMTRLTLTREELASLGDVTFELYNGQRRFALLDLGKDNNAVPDRPSADVP